VLAEGQLIPVKSDEYGEDILIKFGFKSMKTEFQNKLKAIVSSYPEEYRRVDFVFDHMIRGTLYDFVVCDESTMITGGFFIDGQKNFTDTQVEEYSVPFSSKSFFLFDGISFKGYLSNEIDDSYDKPWIFNKTHYSLLHLLSDYLEYTTESIFYVYTNEVEDFGKAFNIEIENFILEVITGLPNHNKLTLRFRSPIFKQDLINGILKINKDYFSRFWFDGMILNDESYPDSKDFNGYLIPYSNIEFIEFKERIKESILILLNSK